MLLWCDYGTRGRKELTELAALFQLEQPAINTYPRRASTSL